MYKYLPIDNRSEKEYFPSIGCITEGSQLLANGMSNGPGTVVWLDQQIASLWAMCSTQGSAQAGHMLPLWLCISYLRSGFQKYFSTKRSVWRGPGHKSKLCVLEAPHCSANALALLPELRNSAREGKGCNGLRIHRDAVIPLPRPCWGCAQCGHTARAPSFWLSWIITLQWALTRADGAQGLFGKQRSRDLMGCLFQLPVSICAEHTWVNAEPIAGGRHSLGWELLWHLLLFCSVKGISRWGLPMAQWKSKVSECAAFRAFPLMFSSLEWYAMVWKSFLKKIIFPVACCKRSCSGSSGRKEWWLHLKDVLNLITTVDIFQYYKLN